jgi:hypothetical protein
MHERKYFTPAEGLQIPDPLTKKPVPPGGKYVMAGDYWYRRVAEGGGTFSDSAPSAAPDAPAAAEHEPK